ncbi:MAG: HD domain-containing protein [Candidatus Heimdallarchaeota archaeon]
MNDDRPIMELLKLKFPQVLDKVEMQTRQAERLRSETQSSELVGFLWEHSLRVSLIAYELAAEAGVEDSDTVVLAALLHDIGKFSNGEDYSADTREEEISANKAEKILISAGLSKELISRVTQAINHLYSGKQYSEATALIHDADRLDKSGLIGLANFFQKWTLRGFTLAAIIEQKIGPEITYLVNLRASLKTTVAQKACPDVQQSVEYLKNLVSEYSRSSGNNLAIKCYIFEGKEIYSVERPNCPCGDPYATNISKATSVKCELILVERVCLNCGDFQSSSICFSRL